MENWNEKMEAILTTIKISETNSFLFKLLGYSKSPQSLAIKLGNKLEEFWNFVAQDSLLDSSGATSQVDLFFEAEGKRMYFEMKCNTNLDSEKSKATVNKVNKVSEELSATGRVFNPTELENYRCSKLKQEVVGVAEMVDILGTPFTTEEYFECIKVNLEKVLSEEMC